MEGARSANRTQEQYIDRCRAAVRQRIKDPCKFDRIAAWLLSNEPSDQRAESEEYREKIFEITCEVARQDIAPQWGAVLDFVEHRSGRAMRCSGECGIADKAFPWSRKRLSGLLKDSDIQQAVIQPLTSGANYGFQEISQFGMEILGPFFEPQELQAYVTEGSTDCLTVRLCSELVAFGMGTQFKLSEGDSTRYGIWAVAIHPELTSQGVWVKLMEDFKKRVEERGLDHILLPIPINSTKALAEAERNKFVKVGDFTGKQDGCSEPGQLFAWPEKKGNHKLNTEGVIQNLHHFLVQILRQRESLPTDVE